MTKWEALIACRNQWQWVVIAREHKNKYPGAVHYRNACACCEYDRIIGYTSIDCAGICPLVGYAWGNSCIDNDNCSFYKKWRETSETYWAKRIVYACNIALEDMIINGEINNEE